MRWISLLALLAGILLSFQNCGEQRGNDFLDLAEEQFASSQDCQETNTCLQRQDLLWMVIREYSPYRIDITTLNTGHFNVGGICGVGDFVNHSFLWELRSAFNDTIVGQGFSDNLCDNGRFSVPIVPNTAPVIPDQRYILDMELVGLQENGAQVSNPMPSNRSSLDIIFSSEVF